MHSGFEPKHGRDSTSTNNCYGLGLDEFTVALTLPTQAIPQNYHAFALFDYPGGRWPVVSGLRGSTVVSGSRGRVCVAGGRW